MKENLKISELFAVNFDFDIVVPVVRGIAGTIKADVTALHSAQSNDFTVVGLNIVRVFASTLLVEIQVVGVENGGHATLEIRIVGYLNDDRLVGTFLAVEVPNGDGIEIGTLGEVNLHPLRTGGEFDLEAFDGVFITIGNEVQFADDGRRVAGRDFLVLGEVRDASGDEYLAVGRNGGKFSFKVRHLDGLRRAYDIHVGNLELQYGFFLRIGGKDGCRSGEQRECYLFFHG